MTTRNLKLFLKDYEKHVKEVLKPTNMQIKDLFKHWKDPEYWAHFAKKTRLPAPSPIQRAFPRIKRPESALDKIIRKPSDFPDSLSIKSIQRMHDAVAGRVIVYFLSNLPLIDKEIRESEIIEIHPEIKPVAYLTHDVTRRLGLEHLNRQTKESGYASLHYIVRFRESTVPLNERPWFEIQVRTLAEDIWGEVEHILGYKPEKKTSFAVRKQFQIISSQLTAIDEHFNLLYEELSRYQEEVTYPDNNPLNAENLPPVLSDLGVGCAQKEIDGLLKVLASRGFKTIGELRTASSPRKIDIIRNTYRNVKGRSPRNFEIVASLAGMHEIEEEKDAINAIKSQIAFLDAWEKLKKDFT